MRRPPGSETRLGTDSRTVISAHVNTDPLFLELGKALYVFQAIEVRIKLLLPHMALPDTGEAAPGEGWEGRYKYLESKEMLGNLVKLLQQRMQISDPVAIEAQWREMVLGRNEVVHHFIQQPFARCESAVQVDEAIAFVRSRKNRAMPLLKMLDYIARGFLQSLTLPADFQGDMDFPSGHSIGNDSGH